MASGVPVYRQIVDQILGGVVFVVGTVACFLVGLPETRGVFAGTLGGGVMVAAIIAWWHRGHEHRPGGAMTSLGLAGR
jgi:hypothetical protein